MITLLTNRLSRHRRLTTGDFRDVHGVIHPIVQATDVYQELDGDITLDVTHDSGTTISKTIDAGVAKTRITIPAAFLLKLAAGAHQSTRGTVSVGSSYHPGGRGILAQVKQ
tara:strand:+ start:305 stop:637 length:333 start_codon:yes stop_codon:yes gene_type:complete